MSRFKLNFRLTKCTSLNENISNLEMQQKWSKTGSFLQTRKSLSISNRNFSRKSNINENVPKLFTAPDLPTFGLGSKLSSEFLKDADTTDVTAGIRLQYVSLHTLYKFYEDCEDGLFFDVCYSDSHAGKLIERDTPTILTLHGSPGSDIDLLPIVTPLVRAGYRVIGLNFPGYGKTCAYIGEHEHVFRGTTEEKTQFVLDFLSLIEVNKVTMLIAHGAGCYPAVQLAASQSWIQSVALLSPVGHKVFKAITPYEQFERLSKQYDIKSLRGYVLAKIAFAKYILHREGTASLSVSQLLRCAIEAAHYELEAFPSLLCAVKMRNIPINFVYSGNDERVEREITEEYADLLGINVHNIAKMNSEGSLSSTCSVNEMPSSLCLENASHYALSNKKYSNFISLMLLDTLGKVPKGNVSRRGMKFSNVIM